MRFFLKSSPAFIPAAALCLLLTFGLGASFAQEDTVATDSTTIQEEITDLMRAQQALGTMQAELDSLLNLEAEMRSAEDEKLQLIRIQAMRHIKVIDGLQPDLFKLLPGLDETDPDVSELRQGVVRLLKAEYDIYERALDLWSQQIDILRGQRSDVPVEDQGDLETEIGMARERLDLLIPKLSDILRNSDSLDMNTEKYWRRYDRLLNNRAETLVGRLQIAVNAKNQLVQKIETSKRAKAPEAEIGHNRTLLQYAETRVSGVAQSLKITVDLLSARGFEATQYRQFIIRTTGEISERVLDPRVLVGLAGEFLNDVGQWFQDNGPTFLVKALIILASIVFFRLAFRLGWWLLRAARLIKLTRLMTQLGSSMINPLATFFGLFTGLWLVGADPTTLLTGAGVAGVIIGFALQESLSNLAAGFFILTTRPFDVDDIIRAGTVVGTVKAMWIANTTIVTFDGRRLLVPNRKIWADIIENRSVEPLRRVDIVVRVDYGEDIDRVIGLLRELVLAEEKVLANPEPSIFVSKWADSWVELAVRPWARNEDWWPLLTDLPRLVVLRFAAEGIEIPYPRMEMSGGAGHGPSLGGADTGPQK